MKYYPVKFIRNYSHMTSDVWSVWMPGGCRGSVITYKGRVDGSDYCPLPSALSIFDYINCHFSKHPDHLLKNRRCRVVLRRSLRSIVAEVHHDISLGKYRDY